MVTDLIHHDPLCYRTLDAAGLPEAFLTAVQVSCSTGMLHIHLLLNPAKCAQLPALMPSVLAATEAWRAGSRDCST